MTEQYDEFLPMPEDTPVPNRVPRLEDYPFHRPPSHPLAAIGYEIALLELGLDDTLVITMREAYTPRQIQEIRDYALSCLPPGSRVLVLPLVDLTVTRHESMTDNDGGGDDETDEPCCEDADELSSHYHCPRCHARVSVMGHAVCDDDLPWTGDEDER